MIQVQHPLNSASVSTPARHRGVSFRLIRGVIWGIGITLLLTCIELAFVWIFNPFSVLGRAATQRIFGPGALMHISLLLLVLVPLVELAAFSLLAFVAAKPLAILMYLLSVQRAHKRYRKTYAWPDSMDSIYDMPVAYYKHTPDPTIANLEQSVPVLDLLAQQEAASLLLLGAPGTAKSHALQRYQFICSQQRSALVRGQSKIPVYVPLKNYSLFLKARQQENPAAPDEEAADEQTPAAAALPQEGTLLDFLYGGDLAGIRYLLPYLMKLVEQGRLVFLCDGLDEVNPHYRASVAGELAALLLGTQNRFVISCREMDYLEEPELLALAQEGHLERAIIYPLQPEEMRQFTERYIEKQVNAVRGAEYTAGQVMQMIEHSRLRYTCTNPVMLFILLESIDREGIERGQQLDTRSRLLEEYVTQLLEGVQRQSKWRRGAPTKNTVVSLLGRIACAARWSNDPYAIQLAAPAKKRGRKENSAALASELQNWLDEHPASGPFAADAPGELFDLTTLSLMLEFAEGAGLIDLSPHGVLSFRHAMLADYFIAVYFASNDIHGQASPSARCEELLANAGYWSEPVALWAGLLDDPMQLAEEFAELVGDNATYLLQALALSLVCIGVGWIPPRAEGQPESVISTQLNTKLANVVRDDKARQAMAAVFTQCADEGTQEIYRSLIPLLMVEGIEEFLVLLDMSIVLEMLFANLCDIIDIPSYENEVKRLCRILWRFGEAVVSPAAQLSEPLAGRSLRLRAAAINILGGTQDQSAVEPLLARLGDTERFIVDRSVSALIRLGPELSLAGVLEELENRAPHPSTRQVHWTALIILERFLSDKGRAGTTPALVRLPAPAYQRSVDAIVRVLSANYAAEAEIQQQASDLLVRLVSEQKTQPLVETDVAQDETLEAAPTNVLATGHAALVVNALIQHLASLDEMMASNAAQALLEIGSAATAELLEQLHQQSSEVVRMRIVDIVKHVHDPRALADLLRLVADPSPLVQQQVTSALHIYSPASIPGLIELLLTHASEAVAERAARILGSMGEEVVIAVSEALSPPVPRRTRLLVQVLDQVHDARAIPALIALLQVSQTDPLLVIAVIRALSQYPTKQVVLPLLNVLSNPQVQIYEEAIDALSTLGIIALDELIAALDVQQETNTTPRVRRAILGIVPFAGEPLLDAISQSSDAQAQQIMTVFRMQGADAAHVLVHHLFDQDQRVRGYVHRMLGEMQGPVVIPALLEVLNIPGWRDEVAKFLLKYSEAIPALVNLLGDPERAGAAVAILPRYGPAMLAPLISALDHPDAEVREYAQNIIVTLVRQKPATLSEVVQLFALALPLRAHEALLEVLTNELADASIPVLLHGLEDAHLIEDVSEALMRLARKRDWQQRVLSGLLQSLRNEERRRGAETALIKVGALAVQSVGELITDQDQELAQAAQHILREIGAPALSFIWAAHGDTSNRARRDAAMDVFHSMPSEAIKDALVELLMSDQPGDISMAQALLLERMHDEVSLPRANHEMIPALLEYVQIHDREDASLRILALLFLLGGEAVIDNLVQVLYDNPDHDEQLAYAFLFLGKEAPNALLRVLNDIHAPAHLRGEAISMLGLSGPYKEVYDAAQSLASYGLTPNRASLINSEQLTVSLRALGSLLASGDWDIPTLQNLRRISQEGSAQAELYHVLLGWRYEPEIARLKNELQSEREQHTGELMRLTGRIVQDQVHIRELEEQLNQARYEHGLRGDENAQLQSQNDLLQQQLKRLRESR